MTTATAPILEDARREVSALESEISNLKAKLATEETDLDALKVERGELAEKIALGEAPASKAPTLERRIEEVETRIAGFNSVLARKQRQLDSAWPSLRRIEAETELATRRGEMAVLKAKGVDLVARLNEKLAAIIAGDLVELDALRDKLYAEYRDIGGQEAGADLCMALIDPNGTLVEERKLTDSRDWLTRPLNWKIRGDVVLTVRNLVPPKR